MQIKTKLLATTALVTACLLAPGYASAAPTELTDAVTVSATNTDGLIESGAANTITIDSDAAAIVLGTVDTNNSLANTFAGALVANVTTSGTANGVTFAGDVVMNNAGGTLAINGTNDNLTFQGNVTETAGTSTIVMGSGTSTLTLTFDNVAAGNINVDAAITASAAADTITMNLTNADGTATNEIQFDDAVGGAVAANAIDVVNVGADTVVTFGTTLNADTINVSSEGTTTFTGAVTGDLNMAADGTAVITAGITGDVDNTSGTAGQGTVTLGDGADIGGDIGATKSLLALDIDSTSDTTLGGTVAATTVTVTTGTGTVSVAGDVTGNVVFTPDAIVSMAADKKITGSVTTATTNQGTLTFAATTVATTLVSGDIGTSTKLLKAVEADVTGAVAATFGGDVNATTITLDGAAAGSTFAFSGDVNATTLALTTNGTITVAAGKDVTANVTTDTDGNGTLTFAGTSTMTGLVGAVGGNKFAAINVNAGTATLTSNFAATTTTVASGATLKTDGAASYEGIIANSGTLDLGGTLTATTGGGDLELGATASTSYIKLQEASAYTGDVVIDAATGTTNVDATNTVTVIPHASFTSGSLTLVDTNAGGGTSAAATFTTTAANGLATYAITDDGSNDIIITATQKAASTVASQYNTTGEAAAALLAGVNATASDATVTDAYDTAVQAGGTAAAAAAEQSQQNNTGHAAQALLASAQGATDAVSSRLMSARTGVKVAGLSQTGIASGDVARRNTAWSKAFGSYIDQDTRDGIAGFDANTYGIAFGADRAIDSNVRLGVAASYANSNVDGKGTGSNETDINSYQAAFYGTYDLDRFFIEGLLGYAFNDVETERKFTFGGLARTASGEYDAHQVTAKIGAGMPMKHGIYTLVPKADLFYSHTSADDYTETGAGALNLTVDPDGSDVLEASMGASVSFDRELQKGTLTPELRVAVKYEFLGDDAASTSKFSGATTTFSTKGVQPAQFGTEVGLGLGYASDSGKWDVRVDYDTDLREDYVGHGGMLTGRVHF